MIVHIPSNARFTGQLTWTRDCGHEEMLDLDAIYADTLEGEIERIEMVPCLECKDVHEVNRADQQRELEAFNL